MKNFNSDLSDEHYSTIEERLNLTYNYEGKPVEIELLDTAGEDDYQNMLDVWIEYGQCILLVFSLTSKSSFNELDGIYKRIRKIKGDKVYLLMVGNKSDLRGREVKNEDAIDKAKKEYQKYQIKELSSIEKEYLNSINSISKIVEKLEKK